MSVEFSSRGAVRFLVFSASLRTGSLNSKLAQAHRAFDDSGRLCDPELMRRFEAKVTSFMSLVEASKNYPCAKKVWVEYLGEHPEPEHDRVE